MTTTREQFLATMCQLLEVQGYHATGLNQLIKESGSPKGSLYYHFPGGKDELTEVALLQTGKALYDRIRDNLAPIPDPAEAVGTFIRRIAHGIQVTEFRGGGPITTVALETAATNERLRLVCNQIYGWWQGAFAEKLHDGGLTHRQSSDLAAVIIAAIEGAIILCRTARNTIPMENVADAMQRLVRSYL
jgi:TetR/AcrR family transcriptional regulator, lmrAB and yxaGH operons repressor